MQNDTGVVTRSYSQMNTWLQCGEAFRLEKILRVPRVPGLWFPAGSAVHATIEKWLRERLASGGR